MGRAVSLGVFLRLTLTVRSLNGKRVFYFLTRHFASSLTVRLP
jgi:hypothetical protein